jgi:protein phosphatase PTC7
MAEPPTYLRAHLALDHKPLYASVGTAMLPHPYKTQGGTAGRSQRDTQSSAYASDPNLSEDALFYTTVTLPDTKEGDLRQFTYLGVADGVGSWREYNVDPREFSRRMMDECRNILEEASANGHGFRSVLSPAECMAQAYERVRAANIIGSCTACVALFDSIRHQLHFSNLGDSGIIVLRHIDSDVAGALKRDRRKKRDERNSDLQISFVSQQQLRSFNHPFQLGWTGEEIKEGEENSFKKARDSCSTSIHLRRGDVVIMATDGLFDNVDLDEICNITLAWENRHGFVRAGDIAAREHRWAMGNSLAMFSHESINELANALAQRARELSVDSQIDSPFAILAKENDIMWSGGMPDDCTVICLHIIGQDPNDNLDQVRK